MRAEILGRPITDDELVGYTFNLFIGGLDTVTSVMGLHFRRLAENPEHQRRLREDPAFIKTGLEELFGRSEEHTSELQSLMRISYAVFCLKKKTQITKALPSTTILPHLTS